MSTGSTVDQIKGQDAAGSLELEDISYAWVIDGAAPLRGESAADVADLASALSQRLRTACTDEPVNSGATSAGSLRAIIRTALVGLDIPQDASATLALAATDRWGVHVALLGDSVAYPFGWEEPMIAPDFRGAEGRILDVIRERIASGMENERAYQSVHGVLARRREERNTARGSGFVVGAVPGIDDPEARAQVIAEAAHGWSQRRCGQTRSVLLATDGAARIFDWGLDSAWLVLGDSDIETRLRRRLDGLRSAEIADTEREQHPRFSVHDDAALAWIQS